MEVSWAPRPALLLTVRVTPAAAALFLSREGGDSLCVPSLGGSFVVIGLQYTSSPSGTRATWVLLELSLDLSCCYFKSNPPDLVIGRVLFSQAALTGHLLCARDGAVL